MSTLSQFFGGSGGGGGTANFINVEMFGVGGGAGGGGGFAGPPNFANVRGNGGGAGASSYKIESVGIGITYDITIGAGGAGGVYPSNTGSSGSDTRLGSFVFFGGGPIYSSQSGGSSSSPAIINTKTSSDATFSQVGGNYAVVGGLNSNSVGAGGGGGDLNAGINGSASHQPNPVIGAGGPGGSGIPGVLIGLASSTFGGGGGGGGTTSQGLGGSGGGGNAGVAGQANTGGGGGGSTGGPTGANGGSGILIVRYPTNFSAATVTGDSPVTPQPGFHTYMWTSGPGTITFNA